MAYNGIVMKRITFYETFTIFSILFPTSMFLSCCCQVKDKNLGVENSKSLVRTQARGGRVFISKRTPRNQWQEVRSRTKPLKSERETEIEKVGNRI